MIINGHMYEIEDIIDFDVFRIGENVNFISLISVCPCIHFFKQTNKQKKYLKIKKPIFVSPLEPIYTYLDPPSSVRIGGSGHTFAERPQLGVHVPKVLGQAFGDQVRVRTEFRRFRLLQVRAVAAVRVRPPGPGVGVCDGGLGLGQCGRRGRRRGTTAVG